MKKIKSVYLYTLVLLSTFVISSNAQITNSIDGSNFSTGSGNYSGSNCNLVNIVDNNSTISISIYFHLTRPTDVATGLGTLKLMFRQSSGVSAGFINQIQIPETNWASNYTSGTIPGSIALSNVQTSGSVFYLEYITQGGTVVKSCEIPITKTLPPSSFSISPTNVSLACNDINTKTFTITPTNIPSGSTVTYLWNNPGWELVSSTTNTRTLKPISGTLLPSDVYVTPYVNGVAKPILFCTVSRAAFSSSATLSGNNTICIGNNGVILINSLESGNTVTWSSSNNAIATVSSGTQSQVTFNGISQGLVDLVATITNPCGQTVIKTKTMNIGAPLLPNASNQYGGAVYGELWVRKNYIPLTLSFPSILGATSYSWSIEATGDFPPMCPVTGANPPKFSNGLQTITTSTSNANVAFGNCTGEYIVTCSVINACGSTEAYVRFATVGNSGSSPCFSGTTISKSFVLNQNPIKNGNIIISKKISLTSDDNELVEIPESNKLTTGDQPCFIEWPRVYDEGLNKNNDRVKNIKSSSVIELRIFDFFGKQVYSKKINNSEEEMSIKDVNLNSGKYILHIFDGIKSQKEIIIIE